MDDERKANTVKRFVKREIDEFIADTIYELNRLEKEQITEREDILQKLVRKSVDVTILFHDFIEAENDH